MKSLIVLGVLFAVGASASAQTVAQENDTVAKLALPTEGTTPPPPIKIALSGKALQKYSQARTTALEYLASPKCSGFLTGHAIDPTQVSQALKAQQPQDGPASSISFAAARIAGSSPDPHSGDSVQTAFRNPAFLTIALSQPRGKDTYYNPALLTRKVSYPYSNPVSVIHEALHNLTGESDVALAQDLGYSGFEALEANLFLNDSLKKNCDSKR
jgi:hypothetical protein